MEPRLAYSVHRHHRTQTKELLVFQGGYRKHSQERLRPTPIVRHHDIFAIGPEFARKQNVGLSRYCEEISSAH
jgi:hypothetical protein